MATVVGATFQLPPERLARLVVLGQLVGLVAGGAVFVIGLIAR